MKVLRTIPWFTRLLVALFLAAQFAGMVSMPHANAAPMPHAGASHVTASGMAVSVPHASHMHPSAAHHDAPAQGNGSSGMPCGHHDGGGAPADTCCALHACFAGLMPPAVAVAAEIVASEHLPAGADDRAASAPSDRLDRPPRPPLH
jgi:hypothetical protein